MNNQVSLYTSALLQMLKQTTRHEVSFISFVNNKYPIVKLNYNPNGKQAVIISCCIHGDENVSVEFINSSFLKNQLFGELTAKNYEVIVFPCINPYGFENNKRQNEHGLDLNRQFKSRQNGIVKILTNQIKQIEKPIHTFISLHQDLDLNMKCYMYAEKHTASLKTLQSMLNESATQTGITIFHPQSLYGDTCKNGIVTKLARRDYSFEDYMLRNTSCKNVLCLEAPFKNDAANTFYTEFLVRYSAMLPIQKATKQPKNTTSSK
jgi:hypothetical protein